MKGFLAAFSLACLFPLPASAEHPVKAETFVDSVGIDVHLHYTDTNYFQKYPLVRQSLVQLHLRHLRDGLVATPVPEYLQRFQELGGLGIHTIFISNFKESAPILAAFPKRVGRTFEAFEAPNEADNQKDPNWAQELTAYMPVLASASAQTGFPVIGPSIVHVESYQSLTSLAAFAKFGNLHNYPGGRNPGTAGWGDGGYGSYDFAQRNLQAIAPGQPIYTTETGYNNDPKGGSYVPENVSAKYMPRLVLMQYLHGAARTYIYELLSSGNEDFGLLRSDGTPKPAFGAMKSLMSLLDDHDPRPRADDLDLKVTAQSNAVQHLLLQRSNGHYYLAIWIEAPCYDVPKHLPINVGSQQVAIDLPWKADAVALYQWNETGDAPRSSVEPGSHLSLTVSDFLTVVEITPPSKHNNAPTSR